MDMSVPFLFFFSFMVFVSCESFMVWCGSLSSFTITVINFLKQKLEERQDNIPLSKIQNLADFSWHSVHVRVTLKVGVMLDLTLLVL